MIESVAMADTSVPEVFAAVTTLITAVAAIMVTRSAQKIKQEQALAEIRNKEREMSLNEKLTIMKAETAAAKERAEFAALMVNHSREERGAQLNKIESLIAANSKVNEEALIAANGVNDKIASYGKSITDFNENNDGNPNNDSQTAAA